jgi:hypothetical protein
LASEDVAYTKIWKIVWERLDLAFIDVYRMNLFFSPCFIKFMQSENFWTWNSVRP